MQPAGQALVIDVTGNPRVSSAVARTRPIGADRNPRRKTAIAEGSLAHVSGDCGSRATRNWSRSLSARSSPVRVPAESRSASRPAEGDPSARAVVSSSTRCTRSSARQGGRQQTPATCQRAALASCGGRRDDARRVSQALEKRRSSAASSRCTRYPCESPSRSCAASRAHEGTMASHHRRAVWRGDVVKRYSGPFPRHGYR